MAKANRRGETLKLLEGGKEMRGRNCEEERERKEGGEEGWDGEEGLE